MNSQDRSIRLPALLLAALFLVSCAHSPDRRVAEREKTGDEHLVASQGRPARIVADHGARRAPSVRPYANAGSVRNESSTEKRRVNGSPQTVHSTIASDSAAAIAPVPMLTVAIAETGNTAPKEKGKEGRGPTDAGGALQFRHLQMRDEQGNIPRDGWEKARKHVALMQIEKGKRLRARREAGTEPTPGTQAAGIEPNSWTWLGPGNIGGRIRSIVIHPANPNAMWVGSVTGGIWRTINGGASWFPVNDFLANLAVSAMVMNPANSNILYAGTGEGLWPVIGQNSFIDAVQGTGIFQSTDGGVTWTLLASTNNANFNYVNRLAISPNGGTVLAATSTGIWQSTDAGANWTQRTFVQAADVEFRPGDSTRAMVGELGTARFSLDSGQTWTLATFAPPVTSGGRIELATSPGNASIMYASVNQNGGEIYHSNDGGQSYTRVNTGNNFLGTQGNYDNTLWLNPQNPDMLVVGGIHLWRGTTTFGPPNLVLTQISNGTSSSAHADHHIILAHPGFNNSTNRIVYFGNDGGLHRADDVASVALASGWVELNNTLGITQFYGAAGNPASGVIVGGTQDNGTLRFSGNTEGWTAPFGNDGGYCAADLTDTNFFYGESQYLAVHRSTDGGVSSNNIFAGTGAPTSLADANNSATTNFAAPIFLDPGNPNTLLAGGISLWRSADVKSATPTWTAIKAAAPGNPISAIVVSPINSDLVVIGHNNGDIFLTFNGTATPPTWSKIDAVALPNGRMVTRLVIDPNRGPNWIYVTFGGFSGDNIYRTADFGATWVDVTGSGATGLPNIPVRSLVFHPTDANLLYAGTEIGIFTSEDAGARWEPSQDGPANVSVEELFWMGGDLVAATHGRGLYRASGGIYVDKNYVGPENGSFGQPFNTVTEGKNAATTYRPVWIRSGTYNEPMTINNFNGLELRAIGGPVIIGSP